jgi:hypothetical protein
LLLSRDPLPRKTPVCARLSAQPAATTATVM